MGLVWLAAGVAAAAEVKAVASDTAELRQRVERLETQLQNQGLLNLLNRIEESRTEIARLRGALEEFSHELKVTEQRQRDLFADLDQRMKALDGKMAEAQRPSASRESVQLQSANMLVAAERRTPVDAASTVKSISPEATGLYERAYALFKKGRYAPSAQAFKDYLVQYPEGEFAANALYWQGLAYFAQQEYKQAIAAQQQLLKHFPKHDKAPDAMLSLARAQHQTHDKSGALATLEQLIKQYPNSKAGSTGRKLKVTLE